MELIVKKVADYHLISGNPKPDFICIDESGKEHIVDIFVDGGLPDSLTKEELLGTTIYCDYLHPYLEIANGVKFKAKETLLTHNNTDME